MPYADPEKRREFHAQYYKRNAEKAKKRSAEWYATNRERAARRQKKYSDANRERVREANKKWRETNPLKRLIYVAKCRAKRIGVPFDLSFEDLVMSEVCPVLGIPMAFGEKRQNDNCPSLDRIDNTKGYVRGNVVIVSWRANRLKSDATVQEMAMLAKFYGGIS
jgi:hypothetical protein